MLLSKKGFPEEDELVLCTVTAIHFHSIFVTLDEYNNRTGMIHISEVAPGRIRNIREFVKEGKKIVCKVLKINQEKGHIDLSLRRVNETQKRIKLNQIKQEQLAEKIVEFVARQNNLDIKKFYSEIFEKLGKDFLYPSFEQSTKGNLDLEKIGLDKNIASQLKEVINQRIKPEEIMMRKNFSLSCYESDGVVRIKDLLAKTAQDAKINYLGGGNYSITITAQDHKAAEKKIKESIDELFKKSKKLNVQSMLKEE